MFYPIIRMRILTIFIICFLIKLNMLKILCDSIRHIILIIYTCFDTYNILFHYYLLIYSEYPSISNGLYIYRLNISFRQITLQ